MDFKEIFFLADARVMQGAFNKTVCTFAQDIDHLQQVWEITQYWNANWDVWKGSQFATLQTEGMESAVQDMYKRIHELHRDLKVSSATQNHSIILP